MTEIARRDETALTPSAEEFGVLRQQAEVIARSGLAPKTVSTPEKILVIGLKGRELQIPMMQALSHIYVVDGKPTLSAEMMVALAQRAGHKLRVIESTDERATVEGVRANDPDHPARETFSMDDARRAGVAGKGPWKSYPKAMLRARAISALCRYQFADVLGGASYVPEELGAPVGEAGEVIEYNQEEAAEEPGAGDHDALMGEIADLIDELGDEALDAAKVLEYAGEGVAEARKARERLLKLREASVA
jgi:hypothetical protein